jgi:hypothetical protein
VQLLEDERQPGQTRVQAHSHPLVVQVGGQVVAALPRIVQHGFVTRGVKELERDEEYSGRVGVQGPSGRIGIAGIRGPGHSVVGRDPGRTDPSPRLQGDLQVRSLGIT